MYDFACENDLYGTTNGKLFLLEEMVEPHDRLICLINSILKPMSFKENEDYALGYEQLTWGVRGSVSSLLNKDIPDLINVDWLGSIITHEGNFVWYK